MDRTRPDFTRRALLGAAALLSASMGRLAQASKTPPTILVLGDSLSAEYGLARGAGWVALLTQRLHDKGIPATVINASISGETTSGGHTRLPALLAEHHPSHVVIELGANDALRGQPLKGTRANLLDMVQASQAAGAKVVLVGMMLPPNFGKRYSEDFAALYGEVAREHKAALAPFLLRHVADRPDARDWFQPDGIHPLAKAHPFMLDNVWEALAPLL